MHRLCSLFVFAACATSSNGPTPNDFVTRNASVVGVIAFPPNASGCDGLTVTARSGDAQVATAAVRTSRERCAYELGSLPSGVPVALDIHAPESWSCPAPRFTPEPAQPLTLASHETRTVDFRTACVRP
jgi:hypothetical protein